MRRRLRPHLPGLSAWFGLHWEQIEAMPFGELDAYLARLAKMPPPGYVLALMVEEVS